MNNVFTFSLGPALKRNQFCLWDRWTGMWLWCILWGDIPEGLSRGIGDMILITHANREWILGWSMWNPCLISSLLNSLDANRGTSSLCLPKWPHLRKTLILGWLPVFAGESAGLPPSSSSFPLNVESGIRIRKITLFYPLIFFLPLLWILNLESELGLLPCFTHLLPPLLSLSNYVP